MVYLDNSATTRPCPAAVDVMVQCMNEGFYNPSSVYRPAVDAFRAVRECRDTILKTVHGTDCDVIFTSGGTEANNLAILGCVEKMYGRQKLAVSSVEHPSVMEAFYRLKEQGHEVIVIGTDAAGELLWEELARALEAGVSLVSCMQVNNETGAVLDMDRLRRVVGGKAKLHVDGVQGYLRVPFEMRGVDMYTLSAHKIHGPKGIGALVVQKGIRLQPRQIGGGQQGGIRSGTENTPGIAGLHAAIHELLGREALAENLKDVKLYAVERFRESVPELAINGPDPLKGAPHILNMSFPGVRGEVMLHAMESEGIYASAGSACSSKKTKVSGVLLAMGIPHQQAECAIRFSFSPYTTRAEIDEAAVKIERIYAQLKRFQRR